MAGKVNVGLAASNGSLPLGGLTACTPGSALGQCSVTSMGSLYLFISHYVSAVH